MKREPNPYAQQRTYTVTQTMAISVPSVVAEDVLDGEDGGMNAADSSALQELQSDVVELKSDVATLETNVNNLTQTTIPSVRSDVGTLETKVSTLIYDTVPSISADVATLETDVSNLIYSTIPTINTVVAETRAQANLASQKSQVAWLTTKDGTTSKLQITSGSGLKALQLTTKGQTATIHDLVVSAAKSLSSSESALTLSGFAGTYKDYNSTVLDYKLGLDFDFDTKQAYLIVKNGIAENWQPYQLESDSSGSSDVTVTEDLKKLDFKGDGTSKVIAIRGNFNGETSLYYYALAASAFANVEHPECQFKVSDTGLLYTTTDGGNTWTAVGSSDSTSENYIKFSGENSFAEVVVRNVGDSFAFMARMPEYSSLAYYSLAAPSFYCGNARDFEFRIVDVSDGNNIPGLQMRSRSSNWVTVTGDNNSSSGSTLTLAGFAGTYENYDTTVLDYKLGLDLDLNTQQAYLIVKNGAARNWQPLVQSMSSSDRQRLDAIDASQSPPTFLGPSQNTYQLMGAGSSVGSYLEFSRTSAGQLDTSAGSISLSNMVWLSANASNLAALLNS